MLIDDPPFSHPGHAPDEKRLHFYLDITNDLKVHFLPPVSSRLVTQNMVEQTVMNVTLLSARTECDGKPVAECRMKIYLEE